MGVNLGSSPVSHAKTFCQDITILDVTQGRRTWAGQGVLVPQAQTPILNRRQKLPLFISDILLVNFFFQIHKFTFHKLIIRSCTFYITSTFTLKTLAFPALKIEKRKKGGF